MRRNPKISTAELLSIWLRSIPRVYQVRLLKVADCTGYGFQCPKRLAQIHGVQFDWVNCAPADNRSALKQHVQVIP
jgi:hypothetical protein